MSNLPINHKQHGVEILVQGTVQGVGFRPFIYNLATRLCIGGNVSNTGAGVYIHAVGDSTILELFARKIETEAPPLAVIDSIRIRPLAGEIELDASQFSILSSDNKNLASTAIPPDINLCSDCLGELLDTKNRRFHYPFINCTNCGPRYTIIESIPYDRPKTSMKIFPMCEACEKEYNDPADRRFHAQPNACPVCGPRVSFHDSEGQTIETDNPIGDTVANLSLGKVVAIRGLGGFHLAVNGCSQKAVATLRQRKNRPDKPLAVMVRDMDHIRRFCHVSDVEERCLTSFEHPIVLLKRKSEGALAPDIAPRIDEIGVMLPYTPLHHLLFADPACPEALVMTSGNMSGTPICIKNDEAIKNLRHLADNFLLHNREILTRVDDSVVKVVADKPLILRRARGYAPAKLQVEFELPNILACGGGLKSTFSLGRKHAVFPSQHIGDLENLETSDFYQESVDHLKSVYQIEPEVVAVDLHPDYPSTQFGKNLGLPVYRVQHHHAHAVAVMAEHRLTEPVLAVIMDGVGLGEDGTLWGGEILKAGPSEFKRLGHLSHLRLPGGDVAAKEPWRMALSALFATFGSETLVQGSLPHTLKDIQPDKLAAIKAMLEGGFNAPITSSCGRLFDAVAGLLGICLRMSYEGQAAMELEALAKRKVYADWPTKAVPRLHNRLSNCIIEKDGIWEISSPEFIKMVVERVQQSDDLSAIALDFHLMLIHSVSQLIVQLAKQTGLRQVVLSGGCMQNSLLLEGFFYVLQQSDLEVYTGNALPINDGAISIGQSIIGGLQHVSRNSDESNRRSG